MLNQVIMMGRICKDIELKRTTTDVDVCTFTIACERDFKGKNGEKQTDFFDVVAWRNTAQFISRYFAKGRMIALQGRLETSDWQDKDGNKRKSIKIIADNAYFGDSKQDNAQPAFVPSADVGMEMDSDLSDDIPF